MKAFFAGSFNPFTIGHLDILARGLKICSGGVVVGIGYNCGKEEHACASEKKLRSLLEGLPGVEVTLYSGLTADAAREAGAGVLLRGFRNAIDAEYERQLADANRMIAGVDTILLPARPDLASVSSSLVRELEHFGHDVTELLPSREQCLKACLANQ